MNQYIQILSQLCEENPALEIITMTDYEVVGGDDYRYWRGEIRNVEKDEYAYFAGGEKFIIGEDEIKQEIEDWMSDDSIFSELSDKEFNAKVDEEYERMIHANKVKDAIFIYIGV